MNVIDALLAPIYKYIILALLICIIAYSLSNNSLKKKLANAESDKSKAVAEAVQPYLDAEKRGREIAKEVSEEYEQRESKERVKTETITRELQTIKERPIYINTDCFDDDGVYKINNLRYTSEPKTEVP